MREKKREIGRVKGKGKDKQKEQNAQQHEKKYIDMICIRELLLYKNYFDRCYSYIRYLIPTSECMQSYNDERRKCKGKYT